MFASDIADLIFGIISAAMIAVTATPPPDSTESPEKVEQKVEKSQEVEKLEKADITSTQDKETGEKK